MLSAKALVAAILGAGVALLFIFSGFPYSRLADPEPALSERKELEAVVGEIRDQILSLQNQLVDLTIQLQQRSTNRSAPTNLSEKGGGVLERLSALENAIELMRDGPRALGNSESGSIRDGMLKNPGPQPMEQSSYRQNVGAEEIFEADSGRRLDERAQDTISEIFHASDSVKMQGIYCKESVCKITYSNASNSQLSVGVGDEAEIVLIEQLSDEMGGADLDIRYARDDQGKEVMYVQFQ